MRIMRNNEMVQQIHKIQAFTKYCDSNPMLGIGNMMMATYVFCQEYKEEL